MKRTILSPNKDVRHSLCPLLSLNTNQQNEILQNSVLEQHVLQQQYSNLDSGAYTPNLRIIAEAGYISTFKTLTCPQLTSSLLPHITHVVFPLPLLPTNYC